MTKQYRLIFSSGYENYLTVHIRGNIVKFPANDDRIHLSKTDDIFLGKWLKRKKGIRLKDLKNSKRGLKQEEF